MYREGQKKKKDRTVGTDSKALPRIKCRTEETPKHQRPSQTEEHRPAQPPPIPEKKIAPKSYIAIIKEDLFK
jgi:hypothetical protein